MRILIVAPMVPQEDGPGAIPVLLYAQLLGLIDRHDVTVVTAIGDEPGETEAVARLERMNLDLHVADRRQPPPGRRRWQRRWRLAATWLRTSWPWQTVWFAAPGIQSVIDRLVATHPFDLITVEDTSMSVFRYPSDVPTLLTEYEVVRPQPVDWRADWSSGWPRWASRELNARRWPSFQLTAWQRFDLVQVFAPGDARAIAELAPEVEPRVRVNPFGVVLPPAADPQDEAPNMLLFVGNFTHPPNRDAARWLVREIMPALWVRCPEARLRIVGTAPPRHVLELASPNVEVVADAPQIEPHLEAATVVIAPVRSGGGMRMKVLQALASGKALVTTARGAEGFAGFEPDPPFIVADDGEDIAAAAAALLKDRRRRRKLGRRARAFAERHHSPAAWGARLEAVYEEAREAGPEVARG